MNKTVLSSLVVLAGAAAAAAAATGSPAFAQDIRNLTGGIKIDGSSTVAPITTAVDEAFREAGSQVKITVGISGTGGGFKRFVSGETDISNASRPITKDEVAAARKNGVEYIELPVAYDGLSIVVHKDNYWCDSLTMDQVRLVWRSGNPAKTWKDLNPEWPAEALKIFSPGTDSGTFDYFREVTVGKDGSIRSDMSVSEDDNVLVTGVAGDRNAIGFFGYAYFVENKDKVKVVKIDNGKGAIEPTHQTIETGTYAPFSRPLFIYVNRKSADRPEVIAFVNFYLGHTDLVDEVGYVKLPAGVTESAKKNFAARRTGTQFLTEAGEKVPGPVTQVYN